METADGPNGGGNGGGEIRITNFLVKLWNILEDQAYRDAIAWDETGFSFHIGNPQRFSTEILPLFFKHNNLASFVRQLNLYGFRKVGGAGKGSLARARSDQEHLEFQHPYFVQGHPEMLEHIRRRTPAQKALEGGSSSTASASPSETLPGQGQVLESVLGEIKHLRQRQTDWDNRLDDARLGNSALWMEVAQMRAAHSKQGQVIAKLLRFLLSAVPQRNSAAAAAAATGRQLPKRLRLDYDGPGPSKRLRQGSDSGSGSEEPWVEGDSAAMVAMPTQTSQPTRPPSGSSQPASPPQEEWRPNLTPEARQQLAGVRCMNGPLSTQGFSDFLSFNNDEFRHIRDSLGGVNPQGLSTEGSGGEAIDDAFLDSLFRDLPNPEDYAGAVGLRYDSESIAQLLAPLQEPGTSSRLALTQGRQPTPQQATAQPGGSAQPPTSAQQHNGMPPPATTQQQQ